MLADEQFVEAELLQQQSLLGILGETGVHGPAHVMQRHHEHSETQAILHSVTFADVLRQRCSGGPAHPS
jgi:hypothetical protein